MLSLQAWIQLILAALKFPKEVFALVKLIQDTPSETHAQLLEKMQKEAEHFKETGRPNWD